MHVFRQKKIWHQLFQRKGKKQSLSYVMEGQTGHQSLPPICSTLKVVARLKPRHLNSDILGPGTQSSQSPRTQLGPPFKMAHWCYSPDSLGKENFSLGGFCRVKWKWDSWQERWGSWWSVPQLQQILGWKEVWLFFSSGHMHWISISRWTNQWPWTSKSLSK